MIQLSFLNVSIGLPGQRYRSFNMDLSLIMSYNTGTFER